MTLQRIRIRARAEAGFGLIEVVVSAALLAVVILALLAGIDGPALISARNQQRTIASDLAQRDQDRMRAMRAVDLSNYSPAPYTVNVANVNYTIASQGSWTTDSSGTTSCSNNSAVAQYIDLKTTVTWPAMHGPPVTVENLLTPPNGAYNLIAQIQDQAGQPVVGLPVSTINSPVNLSRQTNALGCAYFGNVPTGNYTLNINQAGSVDPAGVQNVTMPATVATNSAASVTHQYAPAAAIPVNFDTKPAGTAQAATGLSITALNNSIPLTPPVRTYRASPAQSTITAGSLFPFTDGYNVYAGTCTDSNPATYNANYFSTYPGHVAVLPGATASAVTIREPAINLKVTRNGAVWPNAHVTIRPTPADGSTCADTYPAQTSNASGALPNPGFPFGKYSVCADDGAHKATISVLNTDPNGNGTATQTVPILTSGTSGTCP
jgi:Tfp pilus assembly protein PilV